MKERVAGQHHDHSAYEHEEEGSSIQAGSPAGVVHEMTWWHLSLSNPLAT